MKKQYYVQVRILEGDSKTKKEDRKVIDGVTYEVENKEQARDDLGYINGYMTIG